MERDESPEEMATQPSESTKPGKYQVASPPSVPPKKAYPIHNKH